jgi:hypothetical protein
MPTSSSTTRPCDLTGSPRFTPPPSPPPSRKRPRLLVTALVAALAAIGVVAQQHTPVEASTTQQYGVWDDQTVPRMTADPETQAVTLGVMFSASTDGWITAIRFYRAAENAGPHQGHLWKRNGDQLATVTFGPTSEVGWQTARLDAPVRITANSTYIASYRAPQGRYASDQRSLGKGKRVTTGALTAKAGVYTYDSSAPTATWRQSNYYVDVLFTEQTPAPPQPAPAAPPVTAPPATAPPVTAPPATAPPATAPTLGGFPNAANTGVPAGVTLTDYTGPCTITTNNTIIDAKRINCSLNIRAANVTVTNSIITGTIATDENSTGHSFTITDSNINAGNRETTGIGAVNFTARRVHVTGGNRSIHCYNNCTIEDSYVHDQMNDPTGRIHESGIRMGQNATIRHNTISCDAPNYPPDAGCSAPLTGYGDFAPVRNNIIDNNYFVASTGGFCAYGGSSGGKPYSNQTRDIVFSNNVFERGSGGKCGYYGAITSFNRSLPGNVWTNNTWNDGTPLAPSN